MTIMRIKAALSALLLVLASGAAGANNVDLSTLPARDTVQLTIYNSEDITLVRETRRLTFKRGVNPLQFSWAGTLIDPTSVDLRFRTRADELDLLDSTYPHDKPQMLTWNVQSEFEGDAVVEISYFTSGITWTADYRCISDPDEKHMAFDGFVRIVNGSGEDYAGAEVRLVVGTINLVEKVAELAQRGLVSEGELARYREGQMLARDFEEGARSELMDMAARKMSAPAAAEPKQIIKEGLSEYFIYTIPGTETVPHRWSKRMRLFEGRQVPFRIQYRFRPQEYGEQLVRLFLLCNDEASGLGSTPLPDGLVRLYRDNGRDGLAFLVQQQVKYVPVGQEIELNLGPDPEVVHERIRLRSWRDDFWYRRHGASVYYSPGKGHRIELKDTVAGWDDHQQWTERIRNYRDEPIEVEIRRSFMGHVLFRSALAPDLHDYRTPQISASVGAGQRHDLGYELVIRQGYNKKQDNVTLVPTKS
jgi:hypothetical protein